MTLSSSSPDLAAIRNAQQATWADGDFDAIAVRMTIVGELLCEAVDVHPGQRVLDVATGSGNTAIAAARRGADVVGTDYVPELLERGRQRASAERLPVTFQQADADAQPFPDASFDIVLSTFGAMFAPDQRKTAQELLRVTKPGGTIGLTTWEPDGAIGSLFTTIAKYVPPPPSLDPPILWGREDRLNELFGGGTSGIRIQPQQFIMRAPSPEAWLDTYRKTFGPILQAFAALDEHRQRQLADELLSSLDAENTANDGTVRVPLDYLEVMVGRGSPNA